MSKFPTIQDVAGALGMHKSTVSLALSGKGRISKETRERIRSVAEELGYEPNPLAQRLARGHSHHSIYLVSAMIDVGLGSEKILRIQKRLSEHSFQAPIFTFSNAPSQPEKPHEHQLAQLCRQRPRAIVGSFHMLDGSVLDELSKYQKGGGIVVSYDCPVSLDCDQVIFDRVDNAYKAAMHLLMAGHRQIGIAASTRSQWLSTSLNGPIEARIAGFRRALCDFDVTMRPEWLFQTSAYEMGGAELAKQFLALKERPTGMCVVNDYVALAFMAELIKVGVRIPQELSIIGHDNQPIAIYCPVPLTSATQPVDKIVDSVVDLLIERLEGGTAPPRTVVITGDIVVRDSVAPPAL